MIYPNEAKLSSPLIFDSHAHYTDSKFDEVRDKLIPELFKSGVCYIVNCSVDGSDSRNSLSLSKKYGNLYSAVGIHPENLDSNTKIPEIRELAKHNKCVAIGEIGLDYYFNSENKEEQIKVFEEQIILSKELNLPIIVHDRDAHADTLKLLKRHKPKGVVHCFSGSPEMAREILELGMYIGVGGVITFKNSRKLPEVVDVLPLDRLLLETDCPYLAPEPLRGHLCHSGLIPFTAQKIAEIKEISVEDIYKITTDNAKKLFNIK